MFHNAKHLPRAVTSWKPFHEMSDHVASPRLTEQHAAWAVPYLLPIPHTWLNSYTALPTVMHQTTADAACAGDHSAMLVGHIYTLGVTESFSQQTNVCLKFFTACSSIMCQHGNSWKSLVAKGWHSSQSVTSPHRTKALRSTVKDDCGASCHQPLRSKSRKGQLPRRPGTQC